MHRYLVEDKRNTETLYADLEEATYQDLLSATFPDWNCNWIRFWDNADFNCEAFIKLSHQNKILGLIHFGVYEYRDVDEQYIYIEHLECIEKSNRSFDPVGFWLIWYVVKTGLTYSLKRNEDNKKALIKLDSLEFARFYYRDKVKMRETGAITLAPGEDGYAFEFTTQGAEEFCKRIESEYGTPQQL